MNKSQEKKLKFKMGYWFEIGFFVFWIFSSSMIFADESNVLPRLEGVMMDSAHPKDSIAILDGAVVKKGDRHQGYQILEVLPGKVRVLSEQTKKEEILSVQQKTPASDQLPAHLESVSATPQPKEVSGNLIQRLQQQFKTVQTNLSPTKWVNKVYEMKAVLDLARIYNAAVNYSNQKKQLAKDVKELVTANYLPKSFEEPIRSGYAFYLNPVIQPFGVHADPVKKDSGLRYFFVGQDAVIRVAENKPADEKSLPHDY